MIAQPFARVLKYFGSKWFNNSKAILNRIFDLWDPNFDQENFLLRFKDYTDQLLETYLATQKCPLKIPKSLDFKKEKVHTSYLLKNDKDLAEFKDLQKTKAESEKSWSISVSDVDQKTFDLSVKNPNTPEEAPLRSPSEILAEMEQLDSKNKEILGGIRDLI